MAEEKFNLWESLKFPIIIVLLLWGVEIYEVLSNSKFSRWGIYPREIDGLLGIIRAPFVHSDWKHLTSNTAPMFMLTTIMMVFYRRVAIPAFIMILLLTGLAVWLFASQNYHVGASGVVYGLVAFVAWTGIFRRNLKSIILGLIMLFMYGGLFQSIVPNEEGVSWESHLFGGLVGIATAFFFRNTIEKDEEERPSPWNPIDEQKHPFLASDTFEKTKMERYLEQLNARKIQEEE